jgi:WD40 repeat protein
MAWSPDGDSFAIGTTSGVNLYETRTFRLLRYIELPAGEIDKIVFSPDSAFLAAAVTPAGYALIIDPTNGGILQGWDFEQPIAELIYLKDGTLVRVMEMEGRGNKRIILKWVNGNWQTVKILDDDFLSSIAFVPDQQVFVVFYERSVRLVDPLNGMETTLPYELPREGVLQTVLTHDTLLTLDTMDSQMFSVYKDGNLLKSMKWEGGVGQPTASPDGSLLATIRWQSGGGKITLWNIPSLQPVQIIPIPDRIYIGRDSLAFSPAGDQLAFLASSSTVRILSIEEDPVGEVLIEDPFTGLVDIAITPKGEIRAIRCQGTTMEILRLPSADSIDQWHSNNEVCGRLLKDAGTVAVWTYAYFNASMRLYKVEGGMLRLPVRINGRCCDEFSSDGNVGVASNGHSSSGDPYILAIWQKDLFFYREWEFYEVSQHDLFSAVSPSGQYIAAADRSNTYLWVHGVKSKRQYPPLQNKITFSPDEKYLASTQEILNLETGQVIETETVGEESNYNYDSEPVFSPDGQILAAEINGDLLLWRVSDGALLANIEDPNVTQKRLAFSLDGTFLVGLGKGFVNVWGVSK